jgi:hypothetical protein
MPDRLPDRRAIRACSNSATENTALWPILRAVENVGDFNGVVRDLINHYIGKG